MLDARNWPIHHFFYYRFGQAVIGFTIVILRSLPLMDSFGYVTSSWRVWPFFVYGSSFAVTATLLPFHFRLSISVADGAFADPRFSDRTFISFIWLYHSSGEEQSKTSESRKGLFQMVLSMVQRPFTHRTLQADMHMEHVSAKQEGCQWHRL